MTDISVIILVGREELHIRRCLEKLAPLEPRQIFVVESQKGDRTHDLSIETARQLQWQVKVCGTKAQPSAVDLDVRHRPYPDPDLRHRPSLSLVWHDWPGLYAQQFNWALENLPIESTWILRLDADEYLYPDTVEEVKSLLDDGVTAGGLPADVTSLSLSLARVFCSGKIRFGGTAHIPMVRFFKHGIGRCEDRAMDEHIITDQGVDYRLKGEFADDNLNSMGWWREKHRGYAKREAADALAFARGEIHFKPMKERYYRLPRYFRAFAYFAIRYFLKGGFLDGYAGWMWNFWQGLWYRCLVDCEIGRMRESKRERKLR